MQQALHLILPTLDDASDACKHLAIIRSYAERYCLLLQSQTLDFFQVLWVVVYFTKVLGWSKGFEAVLQKLIKIVTNEAVLGSNLIDLFNDLLQKLPPAWE